METKQTISHYLSYLLRLMRRRPPALLADGRRPLSRGKFILLHTLQEHGTMTSRALANHMDIRPSSLTELMNALEDEGAILRQQSTEDLRVVKVSITDRGVGLLQESAEIHRHEFDDLNTCLTPEETALFCSLCEKLIRELETEEPQAEDSSHHGQGRGRRGHPHHMHPREEKL